MEWIKTVASCGGCDASMSITYFKCPNCLGRPVHEEVFAAGTKFERIRPNIVVHREEDLPDVCPNCGATVKGISSLVEYEGITV